MAFQRRRFLSALAALGLPGLPLGAVQAQGNAAPTPAGAPVRVGGTLALTGPLAPTAAIHKLVGEMYVESLNQRGGLLGRPVEWVLKDDQSKPEVTRALYEQLVTGDKVDLLIGPYATGAILSAMGVAQRYNKTLVHHTFGIPSLAKYEQQFPSWAMGPDPQVTVPNMLFDALAASPKPPKTIAILTSKFPSVQFMSYGAREVAKKRGLQEVLFLEWDIGNRDFGPIAGRVKEAAPDLVWNGVLGLEGLQMLDAMKKIDYLPRNHFYMYPAPGPMLQAPEANNALTVTIFEDQPPFTNNPVAAAFAKSFNERATKAKLPDTHAETQAAASFAAWQILEAGVVATKSLDDKAIADWIRANQVDTIEGKLRFNERGNFGADLSKLKQVQNGRWVAVWPTDFSNGVKLVVA